MTWNVAYYGYHVPYLTDDKKKEVAKPVAKPVAESKKSFSLLDILALIVGILAVITGLFFLFYLLGVFVAFCVALYRKEVKLGILWSWVYFHKYKRN